ncbi:MAG: alanine racemase [Armatimonadetes bacterium]|nr:alanine racemase [Armatimonadota bacterium]
MTAWVEIDTTALAHNARQVADLVGPGVELCAVVKANGYGHGAVLAAQAFLAGGATRLAVTTVAEAAELRAAGLTAPILLLASHTPDECADVVALGLTATLTGPAAAARLARAGESAGTTAEVHLLVDCGMGRDGTQPAGLPALVAAVRGEPSLRLDGLFTHFPTALDRDKAPTRRQLAAFGEAVGQVDGPLLLHAANSAATVDLPEARLGMVRVGTLLYGQYPSAHVSRVLDLRPTWALKAALVEVRKLPAGATIGYGSECRLARETLVGTLLIGWQQGFTLQPGSVTRGLRGLKALLRPDQPAVRIGGVRCPVLGRVSMQSCAVDVSAVSGVSVGDVADVPCRRALVDRALPRVPRAQALPP